MVHTLASIVHKLEITFMFNANYQSFPVSKDFEIKHGLISSISISVQVTCNES